MAPSQPTTDPHSQAPVDSSSSPDPLDTGTSRGRRIWRRWASYGALVLVTLLGAALLMFVLLQQPASKLAGIEAKVHAFKMVGVLLQALIVAWIGLRWRRLIAWGRRRGIVTKREHRQVLALRPKAMALLVAYLVLVALGPTTIYRLLTQ